MFIASGTTANKLGCPKITLAFQTVPINNIEIAIIGY